MWAELYAATCNGARSSWGSMPNRNAVWLGGLAYLILLLPALLGLPLRPDIPSSHSLLAYALVAAVMAVTVVGPLSPACGFATAAFALRLLFSVPVAAGLHLMAFDELLVADDRGLRFIAELLRVSSDHVRTALILLLTAAALALSLLWRAGLPTNVVTTADSSSTLGGHNLSGQPAGAGGEQAASPKASPAATRPSSRKRNPPRPKPAPSPGPGAPDAQHDAELHGVRNEDPRSNGVGAALSSAPPGATQAMPEHASRRGVRFSRPSLSREIVIVLVGFALGLFFGVNALSLERLLDDRPVATAPVVSCDSPSNESAQAAHPVGAAIIVGVPPVERKPGPPTPRLAPRAPP